MTRRQVLLISILIETTRLKVYSTKVGVVGVVVMTCRQVIS
jgi:hypothetical protein